MVVVWGNVEPVIVIFFGVITALAVSNASESYATVLTVNIRVAPK
jgi:hypothetical protein